MRYKTISVLWLVASILIVLLGVCPYFFVGASIFYDLLILLDERLPKP